MTDLASGTQVNLKFLVWLVGGLGFAGGLVGWTNAVAVVPLKISQNVCIDGKIAEVSCTEVPHEHEIVCSEPRSAPRRIPYYRNRRYYGNHRVETLELIFHLFLQYVDVDPIESCQL